MANDNTIWLEGSERCADNWPSISRDARTWVYLADRALNENEAMHFSQSLNRFMVDWEAHGKTLSAGWRMCGNRLLFIAVDESTAPATGCSIDSSVTFLQRATKDWGVPIDWFDRKSNIYKEGDAWKQAANAEFWALRKANHIKDDTKLVNVVFQEKGSCWGKVVIPFDSSWHAEMW